MKLLASVALIAGLFVLRPAASEAQIRVQVDFGRPHYVSGYRYHRFYRDAWYPRYRHYGSYPAEIVIVRRPYRRAPVIVVGPRYHRSYRHR